MIPFKAPQSETESKYYTLSSYQDFSDEDGYPRLNSENQNTFAKAIKNRLSRNFTDSRGLSYSYYIKTDPSKTIYNPIERFGLKENKTNFINKVCKDKSSFTEVSESIFNNYINFLKTENSQWLTHAQRALK